VNPAPPLPESKFPVRAVSKAQQLQNLAASPFLHASLAPRLICL